MEVVSRNYADDIWYFIQDMTYTTKYIICRKGRLFSLNSFLQIFTNDIKQIHLTKEYTCIFNMHLVNYTYINIQVLHNFFMGSDFSHNYLHTPV